MVLLRLLILATLCVGSRAGTVVSTSHDWAQETDVIYAYDSKTGEMKWAFDAGGSGGNGYTLTMSPDGKTAYVIDPGDGGSLFALDVRTGAKGWSCKISGSSTAPVLSKDGSTIVSAVTPYWWRPKTDTRLVGFDSTTGKVKWRFYDKPTESGPGYPAGGYLPAISPDGITVYWGTQSNHLYAVQVSTGALLWDAALSGIPQLPTVSPDSSKVFLGPHMTAWWANGTVAWSASTPGKVYAKPVVTSDSKVVFAGDYGGYLTAFDANTGEKLWNRHTGDFHVSKNLLVSADDTTLFFPTWSSFLALAVSDGSVLWQLRPGHDLEFTGKFCSGDGLLFIHLEANLGYSNELQVLYAVDAKTGTIVWKIKNMKRGASDPGQSLAYSPIDIESSKGSAGHLVVGISTWAETHTVPCAFSFMALFIGLTVGSLLIFYVRRPGIRHSLSSMSSPLLGGI